MLKVRIIPTILSKDFGLVKGIKFDSWRRIGTILPTIKVYNQRDVDELIVLDIMANQNHLIDFESIKDFSKFCYVPLTIGGGILSVNDVNELLRIGADKVSINTAAYENKNIINKIAKINGSQCVISSIDVRKKNVNSWECFSNSGKVRTEKDVIEWSKEVEDLGAGEILLTSIDNDGTMEGFDFKLIEKVVRSVNIPVIASGGAGNLDHILEVIKNCGASAVAAASIFHFTEITPLEVKLFLHKNNIPVRLPFNYTMTS